MRRLVALVLFIGLISPPVFHFAGAQDRSGDQDRSGAVDSQSSGVLTPENIERNLELESPLSSDDIAAASGWVSNSGMVDWLGPLAPVALSPFFGVTCLSGLALWGPSWATDNAVLGVAGPLRHETLFFVFLGLTLLTSLPRLTKVSKPFAQAVDRLETYAVIVILLTIKFVMASEAADHAAPGDSQLAMVQLGIVSMSLDTLLAAAMVINILVINSVKFFFEFLVWLTPVPFLDAVFEVCNKTLCAALMAVYAFSPAIATCINLALLLVAALMLRWISRRVRFYRTMVLDPILAKLWTGFGTPRRPELIVFPKETFGPFKAKSRLKLARNDEDGWRLSEASWWLPAKDFVIANHPKPQVRKGWVMHSIAVHGEGGQETLLTFSRRYDQAQLSKLLQEMGMDEDTADEIAKEELATAFS